VSGKIFRSRTERHLCIKNLKSNLGPLANWLELNTTVDQRLCKLSSMGAKRVGADYYGSRCFVGLEEGLSFARREKAQ
jgi:hypothetical protein